jgi:hypothetical protein
MKTNFNWRRKQQDGFEGVYVESCKYNIEMVLLEEIFLTSLCKEISDCDVHPCPK